MSCNGSGKVPCLPPVIERDANMRCMKCLDAGEVDCPGCYECKPCPKCNDQGFYFTPESAKEKKAVICDCGKPVVWPKGDLWGTCTEVNPRYTDTGKGEREVEE